MKWTALSDFEFISKLRMSAEVPAYDTDLVSGCKCPESGCVDEEGCGCLADFRVIQFAYNRHSWVEYDSEMAVVECNSKCSCGLGCVNRVVKNGCKIKMQISRRTRAGVDLLIHPGSMRGRSSPN